MKPHPQVGDIWKWTSETKNFTYVLLLEDKGHRDDGYEDVITFSGLQIYGEGWHKGETGQFDEWDFADELSGGWEFIA